jgi:glycerol-3-phosphate acyltransferase PlsX
MITIALDILGGDTPEANVLGAIAFANEASENVRTLLIGNEHEAKEIIEREGANPSLFSFLHTEDAIGMGDHPVKAFINKPESSIALGFGLLSHQKVDAFASIGNTGAMLVGAMQTIRTIPGVIRPCISSVYPQSDGSFSYVLDVGTNADCKPDVLYQFALLGSTYVKNVKNIDSPRVALLNIGEEEEKGNLITKAAYQLMKDSSQINFVGNVEGNDLFANKADVIVCDGFTGNIVLKQAEALYGLVKERQIEDDFFNRFNYEEYGGTPILGVNGNVLIGHGKSTPTAVKKMLKLAAEVAESQLPDKIRNAFN